MTMDAQHLLVVRFDNSEEPLLEATLLTATSMDKSEVFRLPAVGVFKTGPTPDNEYSWLVGKAVKNIAADSNDWVRIDLGVENIQLAWQLRTGLFLEAAAAFRAQIDAVDSRVDIVVVGHTLQPPGWLHLVLERIGWTGQFTVLDQLRDGADVVFNTDSATLCAKDQYTVLAEKLGGINVPWEFFGQRRIEFSLSFESQTSEKKSAQRIVSRGEALPVRSEMRLVLDEADVGQVLGFYWKPPDDDGMYKIELGAVQKLGKGPFATIPAYVLAASDPNGGVRLILEIDRFGRCYMTLRDEFDRLIDVVTPQPSSSDGAVWTANDRKMEASWKEGSRKCPANRIFLGNLFFDNIARMSLLGWERLPGAMAATSFNGQLCEEYHSELQPRRRRGATTDGYELDVSNALDLHVQRWNEHGYAFLGKRILEAQAVSNKHLDQNHVVIEALMDLLPQDMHHFRALLLSLPRALAEKGVDHE